MNALRTTILGLVLAVAGVGGAQALAAPSPPLVANCVNVADGWAVEVLHVHCVAAGKIVRRLTLLAPKAPIRLANMTCTVGYAGKLATAIRCDRGPRFLRANLLVGVAKAATPLPTVARCRDYVDRLKRRWAIRHQRFGCLDATDIVAELASTRPTQEDITNVERTYNVSCWLPTPEGFYPRELSCWDRGDYFSSSLYLGSFSAYVKLAPTPGAATANATATEKPRRP